MASAVLDHTSDKMLKEIKEDVRRAHNYFVDNNKRYIEFKRFIFKTALDDGEIAKLKTMNKPPIEFNILEAIISRLRGEFAKQEPSIHVRASDALSPFGITEQFEKTMKVVESHIRAIFDETSNDLLEYDIFTDLLGGGFSAAKVYTDYVHEKSFEQNIKWERVFDPTMCGWDPLARASHKGDGAYCYECIPYSKEDFDREFGEKYSKNMSFSRGLQDISWSYKNQDQKIILVCDFYKKRTKKRKISKLSNGQVIFTKNYEKIIEDWNKTEIKAAPLIVETRWTNVEEIHRYKVCELAVLSHEVTSFSMLPIVFFDGNSIELRDTPNGTSYQFTRPFPYHAKGIQKLKNFSGQTLAAEINNMIMHKFKVARQSLPSNKDYLDAYTNVQIADTLIYEAYMDNDPDKPIPPPQEIQRTPTPPIVENTFMGSDRTTQVIIGSYDSVLGTNSDQLSGKAIQQGALQSNASSIPYLMGYIKGLNRVAEIVMNLIPKFYVTPRSIPIVTPDGKRDYAKVGPNNDSNDMWGLISVEYDPNDLQIKVEAGVNSSIQKQVAIEQLTLLSQSIPKMAEFVSDNLDLVFDNLDIRYADIFKQRVAVFMRKQEELQKEAANKLDPQTQIAQIMAQTEKEIELTRIQSQREKAEMEAALGAARLSIEQYKAELARLQLEATVEKDYRKDILEVEKIDAENARSAVETIISMSK